MSEHSSESEIVNLAVDLFQIVGIPRYIQDLGILQTEQIYFDICKTLFPELNMKLYKVSQDPGRSTGLKIQSVIDLISELIANDLYHISGQAIADGNHIHLKNFLNLLIGIGKAIMVQPPKEVHSSPNLYRSQTLDHLNRSYFTVQGIYKEFDDAMDRYCQEEQSNSSRRPSHDSLINNQQPPRNFPPKSSGNPFKPTHIIPQSTSNHKKKKKSSNQNAMKGSKHNTSAVKPIFQSPKQYPNRRSFAANKYQEYQADILLPKFLKEINQRRLRLEKETLKGIERAHREYTTRIKQHLKNTQNEMKEMSSSIKMHVAREIEKRELLLNYSFGGLSKTEKAIKSLFKEEKQRKAQIKARETAKQKEKVKKLLNFDQLDQLYEDALRSTKQAYGIM